MLKERRQQFRLLAGAIVLLVSVCLGAVFLGVTVANQLEEREENKTANQGLTESTGKSAVARLVSLPPQQRATNLDAFASGPKSREQYRARYLLASDLIQQNQPEQALKHLEGLESDYPVLASHVALKRAQAYQAMGDRESATGVWQTILKKYPNQAVAAEALYHLGKSNPKYWDDAIAKYPSHPRTLEIVRQRLKNNPNQLPLLLILAKHTPKALGMQEIRDRIVDKYPEQLTPEDWEMIGTGYWETWKYGKAGKAYAQAPRTPRNLYRAGRGLHLDTKASKGKIFYEQLISAYPNAKETGLALRRLASISKRTEALAYLDQVIQNYPDEAPQALLDKAKILEKLNSKVSAGQARKSVLTQYASSDAAANYRWQMAQKKAAKGQLQEAWQWAQPITTNNPDSDIAAQAGFWVGRWASQLGRPNDAKAAFEHVLARYPESYYAWRSANYLGWNVGDFTSVRYLMPKVVRPQARPLLKDGSGTLKELYQLGQDQDAWALWQVELGNRKELSVSEQFTDGVLRLGIGDNLKGINQVWSLKRRETPQEKAEWAALRDEPKYWHALFPFPFQNSILNWSGQRQLNPLLVTALIRQESRFEPEIRSVAGAMGLMQVMPGTGSWVAQKIQLKQYNLKNPDDNIKLGTWYLSFTHQQNSNNSLLAVASYNAGPGNVSKWVNRYGFSDPDAFIEKIPFRETKGYVKTVFGNYWNYLRLYNPDISRMVEAHAANKSVASSN
ncbi:MULTISPECIES: transglycosylase SLT domain-containing protein [unclassified Moorena]|uniref:lytic transglycosylase domain-containing protein n=1 Tax=unclassified Moorena TaxID=2683338 RepID=UPI0013BBD159|nr:MULTISPECIES: transglycosylase SLT domain-containing protein [unclassified Moorena]NER90893.1 transglycosylase SLT domain-containing protein [Moorena sp. SIO3A2]NES41250.1 transglycosylase SLT domain-containing protein [Moorena sp. SIO2C4]